MALPVMAWVLLLSKNYVTYSEKTHYILEDRTLQSFFGMLQLQKPMDFCLFPKYNNDRADIMDFIQKGYIDCKHCHQKAPLKTEAVYDESFKKTGEKYSCGFCKKEYEKDEIPFVKKQKPKRDKRTADEACSNCDHFVKNVFQQKCILHDQTVNVYDYCESFTPRKEKRLPF